MDDLTRALEAAKAGFIEKWVDDFLLSDADKNKGLFEGLKQQKRYWWGPLAMDLNKLKRVCGPEKEMQYVEPQEVWDTVIQRMKVDLEKGWKPAPLIVSFKDGIFTVADGSHRMGALLNSGFQKYWVIIWTDDERAHEQLKSKIEK